MLRSCASWNEVGIGWVVILYHQCLHLLRAQFLQ